MRKGEASGARHRGARAMKKAWVWKGDAWGTESRDVLVRESDRYRKRMELVMPPGRVGVKEIFALWVRGCKIGDTP